MLTDTSDFDLFSQNGYDLYGQYMLSFPKISNTCSEFKLIMFLFFLGERRSNNSRFRPQTDISADITDIYNTHTDKMIMT